MRGINIKIINNKIVYLSKFLFLKNPKKPNGNKTKNIGKTAKATDLIKEMIPRYIVESFPIEDIAAIEWLVTPSYSIVSILTKSIGNKTSRKIDKAIKNLGMIILSLLFLKRNKNDNGKIRTIAS